MIYVKNNSYLKEYESVSDEIKYISNSLVRLKILETLYECPLNMKEINNTTGLSYSSISSNIHGLETEGHVYREINNYYLSNCAKLQMKNILEFNMVIKLLNKFFTILDNHIVDIIPSKSITEIFLLENAKILESNEINAYKTYDFIEECLTQANEVKCVLPFFYKNFNNKLIELIENKSNIELLVPSNVYELFNKNLEISNINYFSENNMFLLISTNDVMVLGLFKEDGYFDQNRLLTSKNEKSIKWADNLFNNFKNSLNK